MLMFHLALHILFRIKYHCRHIL